MVEVEDALPRHRNVAAGGGFESCFFAPPGHHGRARWRAGPLDDLIPVDQSTALPAEVFVHLAGEPGLQSADIVLASQFGSAGLRRLADELLGDLPAVFSLSSSIPQAGKSARQLKSQGYRFVGPTSMYALMQNVGVVNDDLHGCFRATDYASRPAG